MTNIPSLLRKHSEIQKKESDESDENTNDITCSLCREMGAPPPCKGHAKGVGASSNTEEKSSYEVGGTDTMPLVDTRMHTSYAHLKNLSIILELSPPFRVSLFENLKIILQLENDIENGVLTFQCTPMLANAQQKIVDDFLQVILEEFNLYKSELSQRGVNVKCFTHEVDAHNFTLRIPSASYQDGFVHRLVEKQLLPAEVLGAQIKRTHDYGWSLRPFITQVSSPKLQLEPEDCDTEELLTPSCR